ncbi:MAG: thiopurine S-methyltransferase [Thiohalocapsa sp.]|jgi:thiopurine S-methyltransferase|uniref:thiopurine S-methyltransferase n=1 Tax=Thiohalocapsa sp. TaxID=2497641 RepID=UPI0025F6DDBE|nr:thiopurine S-methyltransferase [Thiohalocapsa sp.]MCG6940751.1 thiopurine S-methyltransferase [Thiohalocapsa sp.]
MTPEFWHQRWQQGEIGWHSDDINRHLAEHWPALGVPATGRVLVPLCGKSLDMLWLAGRGHQVLGVELSPIAVAAFFEDNGLSAQVTDLAPWPFVRWAVDELELLAGDFFDLSPELLQGAGGAGGAGIDAVYDRASLIALPPALRPAYARNLAALLRAAGGTAAVPVSLLITLDYDQACMPGPPFAVAEAEVQTLFGADFRIELVADFDALAENPRFGERGLDRLREHVYRLELHDHLSVSPG